MVIFKAIDVNVQVDGQGLQEYEDEDNADPTPNVVTKYVKATSDAKFAISIVLLEAFKFTFDGLLFKLYVEGELLRQALLISWLRDKKYSARSVLLEGRKERKGEQWHLRPFYFTDLHPLAPTASLETELEQFSRAQKQGVISIEVYTVMLFGRREDDQTYGEKIYGSALEQGQGVGKKARIKMGLTHGYKLGDREPTGETRTWASSHNSRTDLPMATFNFKYRSEDALKSLQIIPRTPSPVPLEERPLESLTAAEMREMLQRHRACEQIKKEHQQVAEKIKRERDDEVDDILASARVSVAKKAKIHPFPEHEIVHLSD